MNAGNGSSGIQTAHGLAGFLLLMLFLVVGFHFVGFRAIVTVGRST